MPTDMPGKHALSRLACRVRSLRAVVGFGWRTSFSTERMLYLLDVRFAAVLGAESGGLHGGRRFR